MSTKTISAAEVPGFNRLTPREQAFVQHPDVYRDPKKAALESGYGSSIAEKKSYSMRHKLMKFIQPQFVAEMKQLAVDRRRVEEELACIAFTDESEFKETIDIELADGGFQSVTVWKDPRTLPENMRRAIKSVEWHIETLADGTMIQSDRPVDVVLYSKEKALHELAGLFSDVSPKNPMEDQQTLFDNLDPADKEVMIRLHLKAARRAAQTIEGEYAPRKEAVRRVEAPVAPSPAGQPRIANDGGTRSGSHDPDTVKPAPVRRAPGRGVRARNDQAAPDRIVVRGGDDSDEGYTELPD